MTVAFEGPPGAILVGLSEGIEKSVFLGQKVDRFLLVDADGRRRMMFFCRKDCN